MPVRLQNQAAAGLLPTGQNTALKLLYASAYSVARVPGSRPRAIWRACSAAISAMPWHHFLRLRTTPPPPPPICGYGRPKWAPPCPRTAASTSNSGQKAGDPACIDQEPILPSFGQRKATPHSTKQKAKRKCERCSAAAFFRSLGRCWSHPGLFDPSSLDHSCVRPVVLAIPTLGEHAEW